MLPRRPAPAAVGGLAGSDAAAGLGALVVDAVVIGDGEDIPGSDSEPGSAIWDVQPPKTRSGEARAAMPQYEVRAERANRATVPDQFRGSAEELRIVRPPSWPYPNGKVSPRDIVRLPLA